MKPTRSSDGSLALGGHGGRVVTLSPPTSEAGVRFPSRSNEDSQT